MTPRAMTAAAIFAPLFAGPAAAVDLVPHRAVYDLSFLASGQGGVTGARGRIVFEIGGAACVGWTVTFRQVVEMTSEDRPPRMTDMASTNFESADGVLFRFVIERRNNGAPAEKVEGRAERKDGKVEVELKSPKPANATLPLAALFPTEHTKRLIEAAKAGQTVVEAPVYDGSDGGEKMYDTLAVIGKPVEGDNPKTSEAPLRETAEGKGRRWPTKLSYYKKGEGGDQNPVYSLNFDMYENGISANLVLDYGHLKMRGEMKRLEILKPASC